MSSFLYRLGRFSAARPYRMLGIWLLAAVAIFGLNAQVGGGYTDNFTVPGSDAQQGIDHLQESFPAQGGASGRIVLHTDHGRLDDAANVDVVEATVLRLRAGPDVRAVSSPFDQGGAMSADGRTAFVDVDYHTEALPETAAADAEAAIEPARDAGVQVELARGLDAEEPTGGGEAIGIAVAMVVLLVAFGSVVAMGVPIGTALFGILLGMGGIGVISGLTDVPEVSGMIAMMVGLGVGIDYALFTVTRHREQVADGMGIIDSIATANATAGLAVLFAGSTVIVAILGLVIAGLPAVTAMGYAISLVVAISVLAALTLLPALLGIAGTWINRLSVHRKPRAGKSDHQTVAGRWAHHVGTNPGRYALISLVALVAMAAPVMSLRIGMSDAGNSATSTSERRAYDLLAEGFGPGFNGPMQVVVDGADGPTLAEVRTALAADPGIAAVSPAVVSPDGQIAVIEATPKTSPQDEATADTVDRVRSEVLPGALEGTDAEVNVTGEVAFLIDVSQRISDRLVLFISAVVFVSFLLLMVVFRSVLVPLKAALMNVLSIGAAYGIVVAVFQWGWGNELVGVQETLPIDPFVPMMMFAILFGLSMDYEVFLLSRVRERFLHTGDSHTSVVEGLSSTARVITSAALIMISLFAAFIGDPNPTVKMFGIGLSAAVFLDATLVRMVLVPATMSLLGDANWWLPRWLDRLLPHVDLEGSATPAPVAVSAQAPVDIDLQPVVADLDEEREPELV